MLKWFSTHGGTSENIQLRQVYHPVPPQNRLTDRFNKTLNARRASLTHPITLSQFFLLESQQLQRQERLK